MDKEDVKRVIKELQSMLFSDSDIQNINGGFLTIVKYKIWKVPEEINIYWIEIEIEEGYDNMGIVGRGDSYNTSHYFKLQHINNTYSIEFITDYEIDDVWTNYDEPIFTSDDENELTKIKRMVKMDKEDAKKVMKKLRSMLTGITDYKIWKVPYDNLYQIDLGFKRGKGIKNVFVRVQKINSVIDQTSIKIEDYDSIKKVLDANEINLKDNDLLFTSDETKPISEPTICNPEGKLYCVYCGAQPNEEEWRNCGNKEEQVYEKEIIIDDAWYKLTRLICLGCGEMTEIIGDQIYKLWEKVYCPNCGAEQKQTFKTKDNRTEVQCQRCKSISICDIGLDELNT